MDSPAGTAPAASGVAPARRSQALGNGVLFLLAALADPLETFHRARGRRYWVSAAVLLGLALAVELGRREAHPVVWVAAPVALMLLLMASYPLTALARAVCGGRAWLTDATASQGVILLATAAVPGSLLVVLGVPAGTAALVGLVLLVVALVALVALWSAAFGCRWWVAALALVAVAAVALTAGAVLGALLGPTLDALST